MGTRTVLILLAIVGAPVSSQVLAPNFDVRTATVQRMLQKSVATRVVGVRLVPLAAIGQIPPNRVAAKLTSLLPVLQTTPHLIDCTGVLENCLALDREGNPLFAVSRADARLPADVFGNSTACQAGMSSLDLDKVGPEYCRAMPTLTSPAGWPPR
jgi:hypothetical protein